MWTWSFSKLTLKVFGQKLALLMALVEASRSSELHALDVRYRVFKPEGVLFSLPTLTKKRVCGAPPKQLFFAAFPKDQNLCVVQCLREYEKQTATFWLGNKEANKPQIIFSSPSTRDISAYCSLGERPVIGSISGHFSVQGSFCQRGNDLGCFEQRGYFRRYTASG